MTKLVKYFVWQIISTSFYAIMKKYTRKSDNYLNQKLKYFSLFYKKNEIHRYFLNKVRHNLLRTLLIINARSPDHSSQSGLQNKKKAATYSPTLHCSTIGAIGLNFSVRNGKRWNPDAITT